MASRSPPDWLKDFMRYARLDAEERRSLFETYLAEDPSRAALVKLAEYIDAGNAADAGEG